jgi:hypothetical protein
MDYEKEAEALSEFSEADLLARIGRELTANDVGGAPGGRPALIAQGKAWFSSKSADLKKTICPKVQEFGELVRTDTVALIAAIADLIASICVGVSPITVAALCVKYGLDRLCDEVT